jgi:DNA-binding transcriptional regulator GbsR (MarR family)
MKSLTVEKISELTNLSIPKIRKSLVEFKKLSYVNEGILQRCAKTYYITKKGINYVKKFMEVK